MLRELPFDEDLAGVYCPTEGLTMKEPVFTTRGKLKFCLEGRAFCGDLGVALVGIGTAL